MGPLLKVTTTPYEAVHYRQDARLISSSSVDVERQKAIARHMVFRNQATGRSSGVDLDYVNQVNKAFSSKNETVSMPNQGASAPAAAKSPAAAVTAAPVQPRPNVSYSESPTVTADAAVPISEPQADYTVQRASLEWRVASGDLSYVPPLAMTIITQYPEVHFEYVGGYNYVPASSDPNYLS